MKKTFRGDVPDVKRGGKRVLAGIGVSAEESPIRHMLERGTCHMDVERDVAKSDRVVRTRVLCKYSMEKSPSPAIDDQS